MEGERLDYNKQTVTFCVPCSNCCATKPVPIKYPITILTALFGFLTNVERAIIMPTMWLYFTTYWSVETATTFYGATMAAFSLAVLLFTPLYSYAAYRGIQTKYLILFANQIELLGNLAYLVAQEPWVVLAGRFISGIGGSCDTPMIADLTRATTYHERTPYLTATYVCKQLGIVFGPVCTLLMHKLHWTKGTFTLSVYNGPGLFMALLWIIHSLLVIFFYPIVDKHCSSGKINAEPMEKDPLATGNTKDVTKKSRKSGCSCSCPNQKVYCSYPLISMYIMIFASYFSVMSLETVLPPVVNVFFGWDEVKVSYVYLGASFLLILMCIILHFLSKCTADRQLAITGFIILTIAYAYLTFATAFVEHTSVEIGAVLIISGVALHVIGMPLALAVTESLYTKLVPQEDLDRALSYLRCVSNTAFLLGPLEGGISIKYAYLVFVGNFLLCFIALLLLAVKYKKFQSNENKSEYVKLDP